MNYRPETTGTFANNLRGIAQRDGVSILEEVGQDTDRDIT